jgi:hypothetical protein
VQGQTGSALQALRDLVSQRLRHFAQQSAEGQGVRRVKDSPCTCSPAVWLEPCLFTDAEGKGYASGSTSQLQVFGPTGIKREALDFKGRGGERRQTLLHPAGRKLFLLGDELLYVELAER